MGPGWVGMGVLGLWLWCGSAAAAQAAVRQAVDDERPPEAESSSLIARPTTGLLMHVEMGGGYGSVRTDLPSPQTVAGFTYDEVTLSGLELGGGFTLGWQISPTFGVHARLRITSLFSPYVSTNNPALEEFEHEDLSSSALAFGPGVDVYLIPAHLYLTAGLGVMSTSLSLEIGDTVYIAKSDLGFWSLAGLGVETWVLDNHRLGISVQGSYASLPGGDGSQITRLGLRIFATVAITAGTH